MQVPYTWLIKSLPVQNAGYYASYYGLLIIPHRDIGGQRRLEGLEVLSQGSRIRGIEGIERNTVGPEDYVVMVLPRGDFIPAM